MVCPKSGRRCLTYECGFSKRGICTAKKEDKNMNDYQKGCLDTLEKIKDLLAEKGVLTREIRDVLFDEIVVVTKEKK